MSNPAWGKYRQELLASVQGDILEIGFGTGVNLGYYPEHVKKLTTVDINEGVGGLAKQRIRRGSISVFHRVLSGERLPMEDKTFDCVVSTWTLCSIKNIDAALAEVARVLKPQGKFFFLEHGLSADKSVKRWQHWLTPFSKVFGVGCHLDRDIKALLQKNKFKIIELKEFYLEDTPKFTGYMYLGVAQKKGARSSNN